MNISKPLLLAGTLLATTVTGFSHGTVSEPISRVLKIYRDGPDNSTNQSDAGRAALAVAGTNQYYTWNQISKNVSDYILDKYDADYTPHVPDGNLASGGNAGPTGLNFSGLDLPATNSWNWPATSVSPGAFTINWLATAPHDPSFFRVWITKEGFDPKQTLKWTDFEFLGRFGDDTYTKEGLNYKVPVTLPQRTGRHVLYVAWQRIDPVGEVFFSASDIIFGSDGGGGGDPDADPVVSVSDVVVNENAGTATVTVNLNKPVAAGKTASVNYATSNGTATSPGDFTSTSGTLNFIAGENSKTFTVAITNDSTPEASEVFSITLSNLTDLGAGDTSAMVTINDDDVSAQGGYDFATRDDWGAGYNGWLTISNGSSTAVNNGTLVITVPSGQTLNIWGGPVATNNGDGTYTVSNINIPANGSIQLDLGFGNATGGARGPSQVTLNGTILSALPPSISIADVSKAEGDSAGTVDLTVTLSRAHSSSVHVSYQTINGTATAPSDYTNTSGNLEFTTGQTTKTITIPHAGNTTNEPDKTFSVALAGVTGQDPPRFATAGDNTATVTLTNDDGPINFTATGGTVIEGDSGTRDITFRLFLDRAVKSGETASINYMAHGHGATMGTDFSATTGTYTFPAGATTGTITVPVIGDTVDERHEWLNLHFSSPVGINMITSEATGQIIDDEFSRSRLGRQRVVAYVDGTGGSLNLPPAERVTHIMYAFANLNTDGTLNISAAATNHFASINALKSQNPDLKVLLSIGGWTWSANFSSVAADAAKRTAFANSCVQAINTYGLDGIDVDWEWPGVSGGPGTNPTAQDGANYTLLIQALRTALDTEGNSKNPVEHYEITAFTAASPAGIAALELDKLAPLFDFLNAQGYDLHGAWNSRTGHNAGLYHNSGDPLDNRLNIDSILKQYLAGGFRRDQLLVGAPFYTQNFSNVGTTANGLFQPSSNTGGQTTYRDLQTTLQTTVRHWDYTAKVPYLYNPTTRNFISYDDPQSMHEKALYSRDNGFGGIFFWKNGGDTTDRQLLTTISDSLCFVDSDSDGIDDGWEKAQFGDLTTANATSDNDGDGQLDIHEAKFKTNPKQAGDHASIATMTTTPTGTTVNFLTKIGTRYQLQTSPSMAPNSWQNIGSIIEGNGQEMSITDSRDTSTETKRFYRIQAIE